MARPPPALRRVIVGLATLAVVCGFLVITPVRALPGNLDDERERNSTVDNVFGQAVADILRDAVGVLPILNVTFDEIVNSNSTGEVEYWLGDGIGIAAMLVLPLLFAILSCVVPFCVVYPCRVCCKKCGTCKQTQPTPYTKCQKIHAAVGWSIPALCIAAAAALWLLHVNTMSEGVLDAIADVNGTVDDLFTVGDTLVADLEVARDTAEVDLDIDAIFSEAGMDDALINATVNDNAAAVANLTAATDLLGVKVDATTAAAAALNVDLLTAANGVADLRRRLLVVEQNLTDASTRTVNGTTYVIAGVPSAGGAADGVGPATPNDTLNFALADLGALPLFAVVANNTRNQFADFGAEMGANINSSRADLKQSVRDMTDALNDTLNSLKPTIDDARSEADGFEETLGDVKVTITDADSSRELATVILISVVLLGVVLGVVGLILGHAAGRSGGWLFTLSAVVTFVALFVVWLVVATHLPTSVVLSRVCDLAEESEDDVLAMTEDFLGNDTASPAEVLNECERTDGTLANLPGFDVDAKKDSLGLTNLDDDLSLSAIDAFGSGGAFNFGGTDLVAAANAAAMVDFKGFNFDALLFNATADLSGVNFTELIENITAARAGIDDATFGWDNARVGVALDDLNAAIIYDPVPPYTLANFTLFNATWHTNNTAVAVAAFLRLNDTVNVDLEVDEAQADVDAALDAIATELADIDTVAVPELTANVAHLPGNISDFRAIAEDMTAFAATVAVDAAAVRSGILDPLDAVFETIVDEVAIGVATTTNQIFAVAFPRALECAYVGRNWRAIKTDICASTLDSMLLTTAVCLVIGICAVPYTVYAHCNAKRASPWTAPEGAEHTKDAEEGVASGPFEYSYESYSAEDDDGDDGAGAAAKRDPKPIQGLGAGKSNTSLRQSAAWEDRSHAVAPIPNPTARPPMYGR